MFRYFNGFDVEITELHLRIAMGLLKGIAFGIALWKSISWFVWNNSFFVLLALDRTVCFWSRGKRLFVLTVIPTIFSATFIGCFFAEHYPIGFIRV